MDTKELKDIPIQTSVPKSLHDKILIAAKEDHEGNVSRLVREVFTDYFLKYPEKGIGSE